MVKHEHLWGLILFPLVYLVVYGGVHLFVFWKLKAALEMTARGGLALGLFLALMVCAPVLERVVDRWNFVLPARVLAYIGYTWMGLLFLSLITYLLLSLYRGFFGLAGRAWPVLGTAWRLSDQHAVWLAVAVAAAITVFGLFEARAVQVERLTLRTTKLPAAIGRLRIVQISDIHLGLIMRLSRLRRITALIRQAQPDLLVSTGDLVDGELTELDSLVQELAEIRPRYGKYAVTGNHEFYAGIAQASDFTRKAGFTLLRGAVATPGDAINLAGVDDVDGKFFNQYREVSEADLLGSLPAGKFTLLLKHRPRVDQAVLGRFDLQLSGHTHQGQIFPFTLATWANFRYDGGFYSLPGGSAIYTSRGSGTWGPPIRFLAPPEVTIIDIVAAEAK
jgi:uncharacterized protein